jgi:hypothetical protein
MDTPRVPPSEATRHDVPAYRTFEYRSWGYDVARDEVVEAHAVDTSIGAPAPAPARRKLGWHARLRPALARSAVKRPARRASARAPRRARRVRRTAVARAGPGDSPAPPSPPPWRDRATSRRGGAP